MLYGETAYSMDVTEILAVWVPAFKYYITEVGKLMAFTLYNTERMLQYWNYLGIEMH